jgi:hypothetical protein
LPTNQFVPFATGAQANVEDIAAYIGDPETGSGHISGIASSSRANRAWRQGTFVGAGLTGFMMDVLGTDIVDNGDLAAFIAQLEAAFKTYVDSIVRPQLRANLDVHIEASSGNDSTADGTAARPFRTLQAGRNFASTFDYAGAWVPIFHCNGAFNLPLVCYGPMTGCNKGPEQWVFTPGSSIVVVNKSCITATQAATIDIYTSGQGLLLSTSGNAPGEGSCISALGQSTIGVGDPYSSGQGAVNFGPCYGNHINCQSGSSILLWNDYTISGSCGISHYGVQIGGSVINNNMLVTQTITILNNPHWGAAFAAVTCPGTIIMRYAVYNGPSTGMRYFANNNGSIQTQGGGASYFPGDVAGIANLGGQYS